MGTTTVAEEEFDTDPAYFASRAAPIQSSTDNEISLSSAATLALSGVFSVITALTF